MPDTIIHGSMKDGLWFGEVHERIRTAHGWAGRITWVPVAMMPSAHPLDRPVLTPPSTLAADLPEDRPEGHDTPPTALEAKEGQA